MMGTELKRLMLAANLLVFTGWLVPGIANAESAPPADDDASISFIFATDLPICGNETDIDVVLTNAGDNALISTVIEITINGSLTQTVNWTGNLGPGANAVIPVNLPNLNNGNNNIVATTSLPNGNMDSNPGNDAYSVLVSVSTFGYGYTFELMTDDYPDETTWTLTQNGVTIYSGGPYLADNTLYTEEWCIDSGYCYIFTINDDYGDGICCGFGDGYYSIIDQSGVEELGGGEFGDIEVRKFCIGKTPCNLEVDVAVTNEAGPGTLDGSITITASNGTPPYQYSIDGGDTWHASGSFPNLGVGFYSIEVMDDNDCDHTQTVAIAVISSMEELETQEIKLYPNPTEDFVTIEIPTGKLNDDVLQAEVLDVAGRVLQHVELPNVGGMFKGTVSLSELQKGTYFLNWNGADSARMTRLIKD